MCTEEFCASCQLLGGTQFRHCCSAAHPASCFEEIYGPSIGNANTDRHYASCLSAFNMIESCAQKSPEFTHLKSRGQASCLCYSKSAWVPTLFDGYWHQCAVWASTANLLEVKGFEDTASMCVHVGNIRHAPVTVTKTAKYADLLLDMTARVGGMERIPLSTATP